jgi:hypothetical protein
MATIFSIDSHSESAPIHTLHTAGTSHTQERILEARIQQLAEYALTLQVDSHLVWLKTGPHIFNSGLDLSVKIEALRWMLRIARHAHDSARAAIIERLQDSIDQLEKALEFSDWSSVT